MAVSIKMYSSFPFMLTLNKFTNLSATNALKAMLCTSDYTPDQNYHAFKSDITNEIVGTGYTADGKIMTGVNLILTARVTHLEADTILWLESTITARYAVIYDCTTGVDTTSPLIAYIDFGEDKSSENGTFQLTWNVSGIFTMTVVA